MLDTPVSNQSLVIHAERFGYGPPSACAAFMPLLRNKFARIEFIVEGHTGDLHRRLPYDAYHDITGLTGDMRRHALRRIFARHDMAFTAMDFGFAEIAVEEGIPVGVYDALTWFWKRPPAILPKLSFYIAQDFFGVKEQINAHPELYGNAHVVPPIVPDGMPWLGKRRHILLNLGGLSNPFWSSEDTLRYARLITEAFIKAHSGCKDELVIAANAILADELSEFGVRNYGLEEMRGVLHKAKYAFMTSGLGNIYDAARYATPTIWLPPANDSQGQQRQLLTKHRVSDGCIGWRDIVAGAKFDYRDEQTLVLERITKAVTDAAGSDATQEKLVAAMDRNIRRVSRKTLGSSAQLMIEFGWGGAKDVADIVLEHAQKEKRDARIRYGGRRPGYTG